MRAPERLRLKSSLHSKNTWPSETFADLSTSVVAALESREPDERDGPDDPETPSADGFAKTDLETELEELIGRFVYEFHQTTVEPLDVTVRFVIYQTRLYDRSIADEPEAPEVKLGYIEEILKVCFNPDHPARRPR